MADSVIVKQSRTWLGTKYHHQGRLKKSTSGNGGVDCIGLVIGVIDELAICDDKGRLLSKYDQAGYSMHPEGSRLSETMESHLLSVEFSDMQAGDILLFKFWKEPQHVGILSNYPTGGLGFIHCNSSSGAVVEQPLTDIWSRLITHIYRFKSVD